jgi:hypothetical protein
MKDKQVFPKTFEERNGMTLHEHYAGLAMQGLVQTQFEIARAQEKVPVARNKPLEVFIAKMAIQYADALINELEKQESER